ncbi:MAG: adenylate/guanylate cyclase domain-containing protein [Acidimicrobiales bacterium]
MESGYVIPPTSTYRVRRTVGFVDLSGFTSFANIEGDDAAVEQLEVFRRIVRNTGAASGVRVAKWLGDGAMFGGQEAPAVLSCLLRVISRARSKGLLDVHGGVTTGDVILFEGDDYIGASVNLAARLADIAGPGQLLGPVDILPGLAHTKAAIGTVDVPGFPDPIPVADLTRAAHLVESLNL